MIVLAHQLQSGPALKFKFFEKSIFHLGTKKIMDIAGPALVALHWYLSVFSVEMHRPRSFLYVDVYLMLVASLIYQGDEHQKNIRWTYLRAHVLTQRRTRKGLEWSGFTSILVARSSEWRQLVVRAKKKSFILSALILVIASTDQINQCNILKFGYRS